MKWEELLQIVGREPLFHSSILVAGGENPIDLGRQLSRWVKSGKLIQLRRCLYALSKQYQKTNPHPFLIANRIQRASYISLQSALEYHGLIPEYVPAITSICTGRPEEVITPLGSFIFRHIKKEFFSNYQFIDLGEEQSAFIATPEKALFDLLYLTPFSDKLEYLQELRLQNLKNLNTNILIKMADKSGIRKLLFAAKKIDAIKFDSEKS